ncbi:MAG: hypothetical protein ABJA98_10780 [Acidobacteriota bacterium]
MRVSIKHGGTYYADITPSWAAPHNNGALISCGLTAGENLSRYSRRGLERAGTPGANRPASGAAALSAANNLRHLRKPQPMETLLNGR